MAGNDFLRIGLVVKPQGVRGELKVQPLTDDPGRFAALQSIYLEGKGGMAPHAVTSVSVREDGVYLKMEGISDRNQAELLRGCYLCVDREHAVKLPEGRYFICDLIGCRVLDSGGRELGVLSDILQHGAADVYVVSGERPFMVPALKKLLCEVDVQNKRIVLDASVLEEVAVWDED